MTLNEELDVIIKDCKIQLSPETNDKSMLEVSSDKLKSELLALMERKLNEVVPVKTHSAKTSADKVCQTGVHNTIDEMHKNIEKVMEKNEKFKSFEVIGDDGAMEVWSIWDMQRDLGLKKETPLTEEEATKILSKKFGDKGYVVKGAKR